MGEYAAPAIIIYATGAIFRIIVYRERRKAFPAKEFIFYTVLLIASIIIAYCIGRSC